MLIADCRGEIRGVVAFSRRALLLGAPLHETEHWIVYCEQRGLIARRTAERVDEISRLLNGLIKKTPPA